MDVEWIRSPAARRILVHFADRRPAWLWSRDGSTLVWRNAAAGLFTARLKKSGLKPGPEAVPIKGQVARLIRLGTIGRSSLSRVQFLSGDRPLATTCSCTPLLLADGEPALLLVAVDPLAGDIAEAAGELAADAVGETLFPEGADYLLVRSGRVTGGSPQAIALHKAEVESIGLPEDGAVVRLDAGPDDVILIYPQPKAPSAIEAARREDGEGAGDLQGPDDLAAIPEPMLPLGLAPLPDTEPQRGADSGEEWVDPMPPPPERPLSSLFDRLAGDAALYGTLTPEDEVFRAPQREVSPEASLPPAEPVAPPPGELPASDDQPSHEPTSPEARDLIATVIEYADDPETPAPSTGGRSHWMITGRGFRALTPRPPTESDEGAEQALPTEPPQPTEPPSQPTADERPTPDPEPKAEVSTGTSVAAEPDPPTPALVESVDAAPDAETAERVSRYNFAELGRILTDRVAADPKPESEPPPKPATRAEGVINLNAETLVLNRLPLAIMVFREQQVLFANRALTDLLGHESVESLRTAGIGSIFPGADQASAGPVNQLVRRDNTLLPVAARLQSVSWQGRAALMLSASPLAPARSHEGAVRGFAELAAEMRGEGFIAADRAGRVTQLSAVGRALLARGDSDGLGTPLAALVGKQDMDALRTFLDKPARFAETARPCLIAASEDGSADIVLFAEGQAGIVNGYFGFVRKREHAAPVQPGGDADLEPSLLARLSRGVRRPLNTIIGFADLIRSASLGQVDVERHAEYARDIRTAGLEIAVLVDELDDFTRLRDGRYAPRPSDVDLGALLESCMVRVRVQAGAARVLVRSAFSEQLPRVRADRTSLGQALLNLLASAIDQTPVGGSVILSAQLEEDGGVVIHVRDGAQASTDLAERFVVFRDGVDKDGEQLTPVRSSVGLALTRSLLAVNACSLSVDPMMGAGTLFSLVIPADQVVRA